jgi:hypothetical protein
VSGSITIRSAKSWTQAELQEVEGIVCEGMPETTFHEQLASLAEAPCFDQREHESVLPRSEQLRVPLRRERIEPLAQSIGGPLSAVVAMEREALADQRAAGEVIFPVGQIVAVEIVEKMERFLKLPLIHEDGRVDVHQPAFRLRRAAAFLDELGCLLHWMREPGIADSAARSLATLWREATEEASAPFQEESASFRFLLDSASCAS